MTELNFPDKTAAAVWRSAVARVLKGRDVESLVTHTADGIGIAPLYPAAAVEGPTGGRRPCRILARLDPDEADFANAAALDELENGADGLVLTFAGAAPARGFGLAADGSSLDRALRGVELDLLPLRLEPAPFTGLEAARHLVGVARTRRLDVAALDLDAGLDPVGDLARTGATPEPWPALARRSAEAVEELRGLGLGGPLLRADSRPYHEAGASEAQELASVLATAVTYLRCLDGAGLPLDEARRTVSFLLVADVDHVSTMSKFRAVRRLWARIEESCGLAPRPMPLQAETAWRMMTRRDPHSNLLRTTLACVGAVLGGADGVTVLPFTAPLGLAGPLSRRLARNTPLVLLAEAGLDRVADPAAGSGVVEALTESLCARAWTLFQSIEAHGGLPTVLADGSWPAEVAATRERRRLDLREGRRVIVGTTAYRMSGETPLAALVSRPAPASPPTSGGLPSLRDDALIEPDGGAAA